MAEVSIRDYAAGDEAAVVGLVRSLQAHEAQYYDRGKPPAEIGAWYVEDLLAACAKSAGRFLVAERAGEVIGYGVVLTGLTSVEERDEVVYRYAKVSDLAVAPACRGQGIGTALLVACEALAREAGVAWLRIGVLAENRGAFALYEREGFRPLGVVLEKPLA